MYPSNRVPAIFLKKTGYLHITNSVNGNRNYIYEHKIKLQKWYKIIIEQVSISKKVPLFSMLYLMYKLIPISASVRVFSIYYQYSNF